MVKQRLLIAFSLAVVSHVALLKVGVVSITQQPRLISDDSIHITLSQSRKQPEADSELSAAVDYEPIAEQQIEKKEFTKPEKLIESKEPFIEPEKKPEDVPSVVPQHVSPRMVKKKIQSRTNMELPSKENVENPILTTSQVSTEQASSTDLNPEPVMDSVIEAVPLYQHNPKPVYPKLARKRLWQGTVLIKVEVVADGTVGSCALYQSSGYAILDRSALQTVKKWRFSPGTINGTAKNMSVLIPVHFVLE